MHVFTNEKAYKCYFIIFVSVGNVNVCISVFTVFDLILQKYYGYTFT